jgi:uncharacterized protein YjbI with pentapeptide repeats
LWPSVARGETARLGWRDLRRGKVVAWSLASLAPVLLVFGVATFPGEWLDQNLPSVRFVPTQWPAWRSEGFEGDQTRESRPASNTGQNQNHVGKDSKALVALANDLWLRIVGSVASMALASPHKLLVAGDVDFVARKPTSLWSNRLVLPGINVIDHAKSDTDANIATLAETLSLRGRRLEGAVLLDARLRKADFTAAQLQGAYLSRADLREAKFECAEGRLKVGVQADPSSSVASHFFRAPFAPRPSVDLQSCAQLQAAWLDDAQLQGARLERAQLQGTSLNYAQLQGASLDVAELRGAQLAGAHLQGASLKGAHLQEAWLSDADLQGASLKGARLQGASLIRAQLQGAMLVDANLRGAWLEDAQLQGAILDHAPLEGAWLNGARLQGARLAGAHLQGASLNKAYLQGASLDRAKSAGRIA